MYQQGGIELVATIGHSCRKSKLDEHKTSIIEEFTKRPPATAKEAAARIKELTGIELSTRRVAVFMTRTGMKCRKVGDVPAKTDPGKQEEFKKNT